MDRGPGEPSFNAFGDLRQAVTGFVRRDRVQVTASLIGEQVIHLSQTIDMLRREQAALVGVFSESGEAEAQGSASDIDWLRHHGRMGYGDAAELLVVGDHLDKMPDSSAAIDRGRLGFGHLVHIARKAAFVARRGSGNFSEAPLLDRALNETVGRFRHTCLNMRHVEDPDGVVRDEAGAVGAVIGQPGVARLTTWSGTPSRDEPRSRK